ncbi:carbohydrate sulfotransferase 15-like [Lineus longissimus]|uniref:carbohydrate sulfotransferase 15-like n=1 Tax=Lineus longissimus TaxID=88925 RepID=UPI00315D39FE
MLSDVNAKSVVGLCFAVCAVVTLSQLYEVDVNKPSLNILPKPKNDREGGVVHWIDSPAILEELDKYKPPSSAEVKKIMKRSREFDVEWPAKFNKNFRSQCWNKKGKLHCLPNAYLLGIAKCATSSIWKSLFAHPQVQGHARIKRSGNILEPQKESHWWSNRRFYGEKISNTYSAEFGKALFLWVERKDWKKTLLIDGSPDTLWNQGLIYNFRKISNAHVKKELPAPNIVAASFIKEYTPGSKFIISLRNPVDRLYSHQCMLERRRRHPLPESLLKSDFHRKVVVAVGILKDCFKRRTIRECAYDSGIIARLDDQVRDESVGIMTIQAGLYVVFISDWLKVIPRDKFYITTKEVYVTNPSKVIGEIFNFLELDEVAISSDGQTTTVNVNAYGPMLSQTAELLDEFYRPFNEALAKLLEDQKYLWL